MKKKHRQINKKLEFISCSKENETKIIEQFEFFSFVCVCVFIMDVPYLDRNLNFFCCCCSLINDQMFSSIQSMNVGVCVKFQSNWNRIKSNQIESKKKNFYNWQGEKKFTTNLLLFSLSYIVFNCPFVCVSVVVVIFSFFISFDLFVIIDQCLCVCVMVIWYLCVCVWSL